MRPLTSDELSALFKKLFKPHLKYSWWFVIGFSCDIPEDRIWVVNERYLQNDKRIVLINPHGPAYKTIHQIEIDEDFKIERICNAAMYQLQFFGIRWCDDCCIEIIPKQPGYDFHIQTPEWPETAIESYRNQIIEPKDLFIHPDFL